MTTATPSAPAGPGADAFRFRWLDRLEPPEARKYLALFRRVLERDSTVGFPRPFDDATGEKIARDLDRDLREGRSHLLVAEGGDRFVFQATLVQNGSPNNRHLAGVFRAMVDPEVRGGGLMWRTLPHFIERCEALGVERVYLDVRAGCPAERAWKHMGFEVFGVLPGYAIVDGQSYDGVYMHMTVARGREIVRRAAAAAP
ncbi:MAG TPA: GNAT family N-acetyltransferase [Polyangiaceae bacterium]|nr:GNAT family N-acetyltransferase [Polyangiaceae bacterium]